MDRTRKMPLYAEFGVAFLWLIDPVSKILEAFRLDSGRWTLQAAHAESDRVRIEPFHEIELDLALLWG
jgi:Uma2 family endonuclease